MDDVERAREVRAMIRSKAVTSLSIGFVATKSIRNGKGRNITALTLHEVSVVAVPCHPDAQITSLKSTPMHKQNHMDPEEIQTMIATAIANIPANDAPQADTKAFDAVTARLDKMEVKANRPQGVHITTGDNAETKAYGNFLRRGVERITLDEVKALTDANDASAGFLAPQETGAELIKLLTEFSLLRQYAKVGTISS